MSAPAAASSASTRLLHDDRRPDQAVNRLDPIFRTLAPGAGSIPRTPGRKGVSIDGRPAISTAAPKGAGHLVKIVHNGIDHGIVAAYAEGWTSCGRRCRPKDARHRRRQTPLRNPDQYKYNITCRTWPKCGDAAA